MYLFYFYQLTDIIVQSSLEICLIFYKGSAYVSWHQLFPTTIDTHSLWHTGAAKWGIPPNVAASYYTEVSVSWGREGQREAEETEGDRQRSEKTLPAEPGIHPSAPQPVSRKQERQWC